MYSKLNTTPSKPVKRANSQKQTGAEKLTLYVGPQHTKMIILEPPTQISKLNTKSAVRPMNTPSGLYVRTVQSAKPIDLKDIQRALKAEIRTAKRSKPVDRQFKWTKTQIDGINKIDSV